MSFCRAVMDVSIDLLNFSLISWGLVFFGLKSVSKNLLKVFLGFSFTSFCRGLWRCWDGHSNLHIRYVYTPVELWKRSSIDVHTTIICLWLQQNFKSCLCCYSFPCEEIVEFFPPNTSTFWSTEIMISSWYFSWACRSVFFASESVEPWHFFCHSTYILPTSDQSHISRKSS